MAGKIFINYRREDDPGFARALYQHLDSELEQYELFMDVEGLIKPGDDFVEVLNAQVAEADVLLVVIGPRWEELIAKRDSDEEDFVTVEIRAALDQEKRVIPVLVGGASMPRSVALPEVIQPLARRNAVGLRPERFNADCQGLVAALTEALASAEAEKAARTEAEKAAAVAARREADKAAAVRNAEAEKRAQNQAASGLNAEEIRKAEELANWQFVEGRDDIAELRDHLARFPNGVTERYALTRLEALVWTGLGERPSLSQIEHFLAEFPSGQYAKPARERRDAISAEIEAEEQAAHELRREAAARTPAPEANSDSGGTFAPEAKPRFVSEFVAFYSVPIVAHLILGIGAILVGLRSNRKWIYPIFPLYAVADVILGPVLNIEPFSSDNFGLTTFIIALSLHGITSLDVIISIVLLYSGKERAPLWTFDDGPRKWTRIIQRTSSKRSIM